MTGVCEPSDIVRKVNIFINSLGIEDNLTVMQFSQCLAIVPKSEKVFMEYNGWREYEIANIPEDSPEDMDDDELMVEATATLSDDDIELLGSPGFLDQLEIKEETFSNRDDEPDDLPEDMQESQFSILEDLFNDQSAPKNVHLGRKGPRQKVDSWMREMLTRSKKATTVGSETTVVYNCCICEKIQCATYTGMKVHIAKYHSAERENYQASDTDLAAASGTGESRENDETATKHQVNHLWIESMVERSQTNEAQWFCGVCKVFISRKPRGVKIHIIRSHCESNNYQSRSRQLPNASEIPKIPQNEFLESSSAETEKHDYDLNWINEKIEESRLKGAFGVWNCSICNKYKGQSVVGMKIHIAKSHCKSKVSDVGMPAQSADGNKFNRSPNVIETLLQASRTDHFKWTCNVCLNFTTNTEKGMKIHILRMHCNRQSIYMEPEDDKSSIEITHSTPNATDTSSNGTKHEWDSDWIQKIADQSKAGCENWVCSICSRTQAKSLHGIKVHIARAHCWPKVQQQNNSPYESFADPESESENGECDSADYNGQERTGNKKKKKWIQQVIDKSEKKSENGISKFWICSLCRKFQSDSLQGIRLHVIKRHLKQNYLERRRDLSRNAHHSSFDTSIEPNNKTITEKSQQQLASTKIYHQKVADLSEVEKRWLSDQMHSSKQIIGNNNAWQCRLCDREPFTVYTSMRYHLTSKHMKDIVNTEINDGASTSHK